MTHQQQGNQTKTHQSPSSADPRNINEHDQEMITFLQSYIGVDTSHPTPQYATAVAHLLKQAATDHFEYRVIKLPSGNPVVVITSPGSDPTLPALGLNHHIDVVPASAHDRWKHHPFKGAIDNGKIYGRGVSDCKGIGAIHYFALRTLKESDVALRRTVHLLMVPDEEIGGEHGVQELVNTPEFEALRLGFILDEAEGSGRADALAVKIDEKKILQVKFSAHGTLSHGSGIETENVTHEMILFLAHIARFQNVQKHNLFSHSIGLLTSMNITSFFSGVFDDKTKSGANIISDTATAVIDIRIAPDMPIAEVKAYLDRLCSTFPSISYTVITESLERGPFLDNHEKSELFKAIEATNRNHGFETTTHICRGASDLRFYLERPEIEGFGFAPYITTDMAHTTDEHLSLAELVKGREIMTDLIRTFCS